MHSFLRDLFHVPIVLNSREGPILERRLIHQHFVASTLVYGRLGVVNIGVQAQHHSLGSVRINLVIISALRNFADLDVRRTDSRSIGVVRCGKGYPADLRVFAFVYTVR